MNLPPDVQRVDNTEVMNFDNFDSDRHSKKHNEKSFMYSSDEDFGDDEVERI